MEGDGADGGEVSLRLCGGLSEREPGGRRQGRAELASFFPEPAVGRARVIYISDEKAPG